MPLYRPGRAGISGQDIRQPQVLVRQFHVNVILFACERSTVSDLAHGREHGGALNREDIGDAGD